MYTTFKPLLLDKATMDSPRSLKGPESYNICTRVALLLGLHNHRHSSGAHTTIVRHAMLAIMAPELSAVTIIVYSGRQHRLVQYQACNIRWPKKKEHSASKYRVCRKNTLSQINVWSAPSIPRHDEHRLHLQYCYHIRSSSSSVCCLRSTPFGRASATP